MRTSIIFFSFLFFSFHLSSQCTVHGWNGVLGGNTSVNGAGSLIGQTFVACETGEITSFTIELLGGTTAGTQNLRIGTSTNPPTALLTEPVYQTFTTVAGAQTLTINLTAPFQVIKDNIYAFELEVGAGGGTLDATVASDYPNGETYLLFRGVFLSQGLDLDFGIEISVRPIPTIGAWGLIILGLLLPIFGIVAIRNTRIAYIPSAR